MLSYAYACIKLVQPQRLNRCSHGKKGKKDADCIWSYTCVLSPGKQYTPVLSILYSLRSNGYMEIQIIIRDCRQVVDNMLPPSIMLNVVQACRLH